MTSTTKLRDRKGRWLYMGKVAMVEKTEQLWTQAEIAADFREEILIQKKQYDANTFWTHGEPVFPNYLGFERIVVGFNENFIVPQSTLYEIDPMPKPWTIEVRATPHVAGVQVEGTERYETRSEALSELSRVGRALREYAEQLEITHTSPRHAKCQKCKTIFTYVLEPTGEWKLPDEETVILRPLHGQDFVRHHAGHPNSQSTSEENYFYVDLTQGEPNEPRK